jgi:hypothetical protein
MQCDMTYVETIMRFRQCRNGAWKTLLQCSHSLLFFPRPTLAHIAITLLYTLRFSRATVCERSSQETHRERERERERDGRRGRRASVVLQLVTDQDSKERWVSPAVEGETQPSVFSFLFDVVVTRLFSPVFAKFSWTFFCPFFRKLLLSFSFSRKKKVYTFHPPYTFLLTCTCGYFTGTNALLTNLPLSFAPPLVFFAEQGIFSFGAKFRQN